MDLAQMVITLSVEVVYCHSRRRQYTQRNTEKIEEPLEDDA